MCANIQLLTVVFLWLCGVCCSLEANHIGRQVVILSLDGFGKHYLRNYPGTFLPKLYGRGSYPDKFSNQFTTKTFPNHFSVATGVYEEVHGVVGNNVYDNKLNQILHIHNNSFFTQNQGLIPIWTLNEEVGGHSGCIMWPGCAFPYRNTNLTFYEPFKHNADLRTQLDKAIEWLVHPQTPANLLLIYHQEPDTLAHVYGPESTQVQHELIKIDGDLEYFFHKLELFELRDLVDVIILSDHGMMEIRERDIIDLSKIVDTSKFFYSGNSPLLNIWIKEGENELEVYRMLEKEGPENHYRILGDEEAQSLHYRYSENPRISRITLLADDFYVFQDFNEYIDGFKKQGYNDMTNVHGDHGYPTSSPNMEPIFVATGPSFHRGMKGPDFSNIDIYPLLCEMLELRTGPHNGSLGAIEWVLAAPVSSKMIKPLIVALVCTVMLVGIVGMVACTLTRRSHKRTVSADSLINGYVYRKTMGKDKSRKDRSEEESLLDPEVEDV